MSMSMKSMRATRCLYKSLRTSTSTQTRSLSNTTDDVGIVGVPFNLGQLHAGVAKGPHELREAGMIRKLELLGYKVQDHGDLHFDLIKNDPPSYNVKNPRSIGAATKKISDKVHDVIKSGEVCLTLGGDHSLSIGTVHGHARAEPNMVLVWVDAHADINPPLSSMTGNIHGMPLSFLVHELQDYIPQIAGFDWLKPCLHAKDIAFIGVRDLDPAERYIIEHYGITCFTMHDVDRYGIDYILEKAISIVNPNFERPMHLSYDIDALDPAVSPSTGTPVPGGLTVREGMYIAEELALTGKLTGIDLVEVNPELGSQRDKDLTLFTGTEVIAACFGKRRHGNVPSNYKLTMPDKARSNQGN